MFPGLEAFTDKTLSYGRTHLFTEAQQLEVAIWPKQLEEETEDLPAFRQVSFVARIRASAKGRTAGAAQEFRSSAIRAHGSIGAEVIADVSQRRDDGGDNTSR